MNNLINLIKENKNKCYVIFGILILIVIFLIINMLNNKDNVNKINKNKEYVYTLIEKNDKQKLPYININNKKIEKVNDKLYEDFYITTSNEENTYTYKSYLDDNILYLFIKIEELRDEVKNPRYISYYIDVDKNILYNLEDILKLHKLDINEVNVKIDNELNNTYIEETELGYVEKGFCDFECYKDIHDIIPIENNLELFYNGKELKGYLNYTVETIYYVDTNPIVFPHIFKF